MGSMFVAAVICTMRIGLHHRALAAISFLVCVFAVNASDTGDQVQLREPSPFVRVTGGSRATYGFLQLRHPSLSSQSWRTIESFADDVTAQFVCWELGFAPHPMEQRVSFPRALVGVAHTRYNWQLTSLGCPLNATAIANCTLSEQKNSFLPLGIDCTNSSFEFRFVPLYNNTSVGLFQLRQRDVNTSMFGGICATGIDNRVAQALCFSAGLPHTGAVTFSGHPEFHDQLNWTHTRHLESHHNNSRLAFATHFECPWSDSALPASLHDCGTPLHAMSWPEEYSLSRTACSPAFVRCGDVDESSTVLRFNASDPQMSIMAANSGIVLTKHVGSGSGGATMDANLTNLVMMSTCLPSWQQDLAHICRILGFAAEVRESEPALVITTASTTTAIGADSSLRVVIDACPKKNATHPAPTPLLTPHNCSLRTFAHPSSALTSTCPEGPLALDCHTGAWEFGMASLNDFQRPASSWLALGVPVVKVSPRSGWLPICGDTTQFVEAALCNATGAPEIKNPVSTVISMPSTAQPVIASLRCALRGQTSLNACSRSLSLSLRCSTLALQCAPKWEFRLAGAESGPRHGRLEVRPGVGLSWGSVCSSGFGIKEAVRACRSLGIPNDNPVVQANFGGGSSPSYMSQVSCSDDSVELPECSFTYTTSESIRVMCTTSNVVAIDCRNRTYEFRLTSDGKKGGDSLIIEGFLEVRPFPSAAWGAVCSPRFDRAAAVVACRSVGTPARLPLYVTEVASSVSVATSHMSQVVCSGEEASLSNCSFTPSFPGFAPLCDANRSSVFLDCADHGWEFRLSGNQSGPQHGRLEVRPGLGFPWGSVCSSGFGVKEAVRACRSLGIPNDNPVVQANFGGGSGPIYMSQVSCSDDSVELPECSFTYSSPEFVRSSCTHSNVVAIDCSNRTWEARLLDGFDDSAGVLQVRPHAAAPWGVVCDTQFDAAAARVACRAAGFPNVTIARRLLKTTSNLSVAHLSGVFCRGAEESLADCSLIAWFPGTTMACDPSTEAVQLDCGRREWSGQITRDENADSDHMGVLRVRPDSSHPWGHICSHPIQSTRATLSALCRTVLGRATAHPRWRPAFLSQEEPVYATRLDCGNNATALGECQFTVVAPEKTAGNETPCASRSGMWLDCSENVLRFRFEETLSNSSGALAMYASTTQQWHAICFPGSFSGQRTARVCDHLSMPSASGGSFAYQRNPLPKSPRVMQLSHCAMDSNDPQDCSFIERSPTQCPEFTGVFCTNSTPATRNDVTLVGGLPGSAAGLLAMQRPGSGIGFGLVCATTPTDATSLPWSCADLQMGERAARAVDASRFAAAISHFPILYDSGSRSSMERAAIFVHAQCAGALIAADCTPGVGSHVEARIAKAPLGRLQVSPSALLAGRLEMRESRSSSFGTVCGVGVNIATVRGLCKLLGFHNAAFRPALFRTITRHSPARHQPHASRFGERIQCTERGEGGFGACAIEGHAAGGATSCAGAGDLGVDCAGAAAVAADVSAIDGDTAKFLPSVLISVAPAAAAAAQNMSVVRIAVCGWVDNFFARAACAAVSAKLGLPAISGVIPRIVYLREPPHSLSENSSDLPAFPSGQGFADVSCEAADADLRSCTAQRSSADCSEESVPMIDCAVAHDVEFALHRLSSTDAASIESISGSGIVTGLLLARLKQRIGAPSVTAAAGEEDEWGFVCDADFSDVEANVACKTLGVADLGVTRLGLWPPAATSHQTSMHPRVPLALFNVKCNFDHPVDTLESCSFVTASASFVNATGAQMRDRLSVCSQEEHAVVISCGAQRVPASGDGGAHAAVRLPHHTRASIAAAVCTFVGISAFAALVHHVLLRHLISAPSPQ